jgi:5-methylcytosine-specific restriction endonuclease McrA
MSKKHTIKFIQEQFEKEGYTLLSDTYINNKQKLKYICPKGHNRYTRFDCWQRGARCQKCYLEKNNKGENNPMFGKDFSGENNPMYGRCGENSPNYGKKYPEHSKRMKGNNPSEKTRKKLSEGKRGKNNPMYGICGELCPSYKSNLTEEDRQDRRLIPEYREWAKQIKIRDNFICQVCGDSKGGNLVSHHLESYNNNKDLRVALDNGVCLCEECHKDFHHQYGYGNNTKEQFSEFLCAQKILLETLGDV